MTTPEYPAVLKEALVGTYPASTKAGGGYVWDEVLEYRVWCHPDRGAEDHHDGSDYFFAFESYDAAAIFFARNSRHRAAVGPRPPARVH